MNSWPIINHPEDLPEDGRYDRMYAEWLVADGVIDREDLELQIRLTRGNRSARLKALEDFETSYNPESRMFTRNGVTWAQRTTPFKRGKHRKD